MNRINRILQAVSAEPWAILPEKLDAICELLELRAAGVEFSAEEIEARIADRRPGGGSLQTRGGVAVLPLYGVVAHRMGMMAQMSGGTSVQRFSEQFDAALANEEIGTIVIDVDSPGGSVTGVEELSRKVYDARGKKRIIAISNGMMASAAYWIGTAADELVVIPSGEVGSIGVFAIHTDRSKADERDGISRTIIKAGKYKAEGNPHEPLSDEARKYAQQSVEDYYELFAGAVARNRGVDVDQVKNGYGEGRSVTAKRAVELGMADRVATLEQLLEELGVRRSSTSAGRSATGTSTSVASSADGAAPGEGISPPSIPPAPMARRNTVDENENTAAQPGAATPAVAVGADHAADERAAQITELCALHELPSDRVAAFIRGGQSIGQVASAILTERRSSQKPVKPAAAKPAVDLTERERNQFSIGAAIMQAAGIMKPGLESEVSAALEEKFPEGGIRGGGILIPTYGLAPVAAGNDTRTATAGQELVFTEEGDFIERLRNRALVIQLGATFLPGLVGNYAEPRATGDPSASWQQENPGANAAESALAFDQVTLTPKLLIGSVPFSRLLFRQTRVSYEDRVRAALAAVHARALDLAALHGPGTGNQPTGIYAKSGINAVAFGGSITFAKAIEMETAIIADNADVGTMAYLSTPETRGKAKQTAKDAGSGQMLWTGSVEDGEMNGYKAAATNQLSKVLGVGTNEHGIVFGAWQELLIGEWGVLELIVDPYTLKRQGMIEVTSYQTANLAFRHEEAFCKGTGLVP